MKKFIFIIPFLVVALFHSQSLSNTENYIYSRTYLEPVTTEQANASQIQNVQYFDGLGRNIQNIAIKASPNGKDLVIPVLYDDQSGKRTKDYLPQPVDSQNGAYISSVGESSVNAYYGISNAYSEVVYEKSPMGRVLKSATPGSDWQIGGTRTPQIDYLSNNANEVKRYKAAITWNASTQINDVAIALAPADAYTTNGYYNANVLYKMVTKDEESSETHTFINSRKQTVLVRKINKKPNGTTENMDTYYVYDDFGNTVCVIPPKAASSGLSTTVLNNLCYQYKFDKYNRLVEKKLPGKGWEYMVYDKQNRIVLSQDVNLRNQGRWLFIKYDQFSRSIYTGILDSYSDRIAQVNAIEGFGSNNEAKSTTSWNNSGMEVYYTNTTAYPTANFKILSVNYYDQYPAGSPSQPSLIQNQKTLTASPATIVSNGLSSIRSTQSLPTASYTKNIENDSWSSAFIWYDTQGRVIGTYGKNHLGGFTQTEAVLDFSGRTKEAYTYHSKNTTSAQVTVKDRYTYSPQNFLLKHYQQVGSGMEELLSDYTYNDLGQVINKKVGNNIQSVDYTYNIKGWLTGINPNEIGNLGNKLFAYKIKYTQREGAEVPNNEYPDLKVKPKYDGSIAEVDWKTANDNILRRYGYSYDGANRLRGGFYQTDANPYLKEYNEILDYDLGGNITTLKRTANSSSGTAITIDNLAYSYDGGNRLTNVSDSSQNYAGYPSSSGTLIDYDDNGNMTSQKDKGILSISYNHLDLPSSVIYDTTYILHDLFFGDVQKNVNTQYTYRSDGAKLKAEYTYFSGRSQMEIKKITEYLDGFQYENDILQFLENDEGYYDFTQNKYIYNYVDHLGNVRLSYTRNATGGAVIIDENNYYPLGLRHTGYNFTGTVKPYRKQYNGKEIQESGMLDYGWRNYMPEIGRWGVMDQLSENYFSTSPYAYVLNNPVNMFDPDGRETMAALTMALWNLTPEGTNSYWQQGSGSGSGGKAGGGGGSGHFVYVGGTAGLSGGYGIGSTLDFAGNFNSYYGNVTNGVLNYTYWTNGEAAYGNSIQGLDGHKATLNLNPSSDSNKTTSYLEIIETVNDYRDIVGGSLSSNAGLTRLGTNGQIYFPTVNGRVFYGNQYVRTASLAKWGGVASKGAMGVSVVIGLINTGQGYQEDGRRFGRNAQKAVAKTTGSILGGWAGAEAGAFMGAEFGATIGSVFPGAGTVIGGIVGGFVGGAIGAFGGGIFGAGVGEGSVEAYYMP